MAIISQCGSRYTFDTLVIGAGAAGLSFCLELAKQRPRIRIAFVAKKRLLESNSRYAQGGIAAAQVDPYSIQRHTEDTIVAGDGLCCPAVVEQVIQQGQDRIADLMAYGVPFSMSSDHRLVLGQEGGHSERRIYHSGDHTGLAIVETLIKNLHDHPNITIFENHCAIDLITQTVPHQPGARAEVLGAYVFDDRLGLIHTFLANTTILATGGAGKIYRYTSNPEIATGDGIAMACRAGARVGNMEFYQFHPTLLYHHQLNNFLISEALRGEGARLLLPDTGERFMERYDKKRLELSTRDVVARAIFSEIERNAYKHVLLDVSHLDRDFLKKRFSTIYETLFSLGIDMAQDTIPVVPAAHYLCGGVLTDLYGRTDLHRLYVIGESAFTGLHGANRLASNSLLETCVMGYNAAQESQHWLDQPLQLLGNIQDWNSESVKDLRRASQINAHWRGLRGEMTSYAGIVRTEAGLSDLLTLVATRRQSIEEYYWKHMITRDLLELRNIILVAELIVRSAQQRRESRGGHYREDYPEKTAIAEESVLQFHESFGHFSYHPTRV